MTTPSGGAGLSQEARRDLLDARRALVARQAIVPRLLAILEPRAREDDDVVASALIALAKLTTDAGPSSLIQRYATDARASDYVRESAALALGLLRRSDPAQRMSADAADLVRIALLRLAADDEAPWRTRAFALYAVGLLADQPYGAALGQQGERVTVALARHLEERRLSTEIRMAALVALGLQPPAGVPAQVTDDLRAIVVKGRLGRVRWSDEERSHALTALARLRAPAWDLLVFRVLGDTKSSLAVRRAGYLALSGSVGRLPAALKPAALEALAGGLARTRDDLTYGLGLIALGRAMAVMPATTPAMLPHRSLLLQGVRRGPSTRRGYAALALGFAAGGITPESASADEDAAAFRKRAAELLVGSLRARRGDAALQAAYAVALGLLGDPATAEPLCETVGDRHAEPYLRAESAIALALVGAPAPATRKVLHTALRDEDADLLRSEAALALSLSEQGGASQLLLPLLASTGARRVAGPLAVAIGTLGDADAAPALLRVAGDSDRTASVRAQAVAALGLLCDPEPRPSLFRVSMDANYTGSSNALYELFDIL